MKLQRCFCSLAQCGEQRPSKLVSFCKRLLRTKMEFERKKHIQFFLYHLRSLPGPYGSLDTSRMTILYFAVSGLDVLGAIDMLPAEKKAAIVNWIYSLQILPDPNDQASGALVFQPKFSTQYCSTAVSEFALLLLPHWLYASWSMWLPRQSLPRLLLQPSVGRLAGQPRARRGSPGNDLHGAVCAAHSRR